MTTTRALIVGGGIAGPTLGLGLRRLGYSVSVLEARPTIEPEQGAFLGVAPNGMNAFAELGLAGQIRAVGHGCHELRFANQSGRNIAAIDRSADEERFGWPLTMVRRGRLHVLLAQAAVRGGVELRLGAEVVGVEDRPGAPVRVALASGERLEADIVFGCDGVGSTVRKLILPDAPSPARSGLLDFGGFCSAPIPAAIGTNLMLFGRRGFFGAFGTSDGETWWFHNGPKASVEDPRSHLLAMHAEDAPWVRRIIEATTEILGPWPLQRAASLRTWSAGRVCLLGDAAHAMSPSAGQGASMAAEDVIALVRALSEAPEPAIAFQRFEADRRSRVEAIARAADRNDGGKTGAGPVAAWFRDRMLGFFLPKAGAAQTRSYAHRELLRGTS